ncbi:galactose-specific lectin nattectin-like [Perca flavescens]|uniref:galactose-specific lectin nattectin-like n=1 Tax=Perca flavescens TaxID=8167 RepID=UPI00106ED5F2|nr:galactose-specific lectin nattectin-like [Perca flavescens]
MASVFLFALLLCLSSGLLTAGAASCPSGWTQLGSRCFAFYNQAKTWADAEFLCRGAGGHLASIRSAEEHAFLKNYINQVTGTQKTSWIGGTDAVQLFTWLWTDRSHFTYKSWNAGEPNNYGGAEFCIVMNWGGANWNDWGCNKQASFVCSKNSA